MIKYIRLAGIIVLIGLICSVIFLSIKNSSLQESIRLYDNNFKAINLENSELRNEIIAYRFDVEQLEFINDSIIKNLNDTRRELGIKDKQLKQMQKIKTEIITRDSIFVRDTIFRDNFIKLDTLISNEWYSVRLGLEYPNKIEINAKYNTDLSVFAYSSKEILGNRKKCFIGRWFQKKNKIIRVEIKDNNPHSIIKESKYIIVE